MLVLRPLFSTYQQGENRVTASLLAVLERLSLHVTERVLGSVFEDAGLQLVSFTPLPHTAGVGNPDGEIRSDFHLLIETKIQPDALKHPSAAALKLAYAGKLRSGGRLLVLTPDQERPAALVTDDPRVAWTNFVNLAAAFTAVLEDEDEPASEHERYLIRELVALFRATGLLESLDTVVVAARSAYPLYLQYHAYVCQPDRAIKPVRYMAFYTGRQIKVEVPHIEHRRAHVEFSRPSAAGSPTSGSEVDKAIAQLIAQCLADGTHTEGALHDVYLLSAPDDAATILLGEPIAHTGSFAFTMGQRYVDSAQLRSARSTSQL